MAKVIDWRYHATPQESRTEGNFSFQGIAIVQFGFLFKNTKACAMFRTYTGIDCALLPAQFLHPYDRKALEAVKTTGTEAMLPYEVERQSVCSRALTVMDGLKL